jgi:hypothetical protein
MIGDWPLNKRGPYARDKQNYPRVSRASYARRKGGLMISVRAGLRTCKFL